MYAFDVIIVGGGPAGATAGYLLAGHGLSTAIVDRKVFPRHKLCGGLLPVKTAALLERIFGVTGKDLADQGIVNHTSSGYGIYWRQRLIVQASSDLPFSFVDRKAYDNYLLGMARSRGAAVFEGHRVTGVDPAAGTVIMASGAKMSARYIIGADGVLSEVRKWLPGMGGTPRKDRLAAALEVFVPRAGMRMTVDCPAVHLGYVNSGYAWVFPNRDRFVVGLGGMQDKNILKFNKILADYLTDLDLAAPREGLRGLKVHAHPIPFGSPLRRPAHLKVVLSGDAAGMADPITGEGIYYAHRSAEVAARSIMCALRTGRALHEIYPSLLERHVMPELRSAAWLRFVVFNAMRVLPPALVCALVRWGHSRALGVIHGTRPYPLNTRGRGMYGDIPDR